MDSTGILSTLPFVCSFDPDYLKWKKKKKKKKKKKRPFQPFPRRGKLGVEAVRSHSQSDPPLHLFMLERYALLL
jgi:hypothetical protein